MSAMFKRAHHQRIAEVLSGLDGALLKHNRCLFGGGTAIALLHGEYRESVDIDFLVSDLPSYRNLRQLLTAEGGVATIVRIRSRKMNWVWLFLSPKKNGRSLIISRGAGGGASGPVRG